MDKITNYIGGILESVRRGIVYSVEHMTVTQWSILGITSVVIGFMLLKSTKR